VTGRFAPSPTGPLHFGSLVAALGSYLFAKAAGGRWLLRVEDLDTPRVVPGMEADILRTLEGLGFAWEGPVIRQSLRTDAYAEAFDRLQGGGFLYPCGCTRREVREAASAPHAGEEEALYPGTCRDGLPPEREARAHRFRVLGEEIVVADLVQGVQRWRPSLEVGDFVVRRADGLFSYQLAVVVDDAESSVTEVARGADLLSSTPRQILLQEALGLPRPRYAHLPLVTGPGGTKLSKRDATLSQAAGLDPAKEGSALLCRALRFLGQRVDAELSLAPPGELLAFATVRFDPAAVPSEPGPFPPR